jgi:outer membrane protein assembly factor BamA
LQDTRLPEVRGGAVSGVGFVYTWDTRDNIFFPNSGGFNEVKAIFYTKDLRSDYTFSYFNANIRRYWNFGLDKVLAVQTFYEVASGNPPFYKYPALGGSNVMRGYFYGRYRDHNYLALQVEYRQYFWWRFGFVVFAGFGDVEDEITRFSLTNLKETWGFGLRFLFNEEKKINLRMDIGFGQDTNGIYFGMEEAF